jgi:hypothetical protein
MKARNIDLGSHRHIRKTRSLICPRPGSEKVYYFADLVVKVFTAGVPAVALIIATIWAINLPQFELFAAAGIWVKGIAILAVVPTAAWLYASIYQLKEAGWA